MRRVWIISSSAAPRSSFGSSAVITIMATASRWMMESLASAYRVFPTRCYATGSETRYFPPTMSCWPTWCGKGRESAAPSAVSRSILPPIAPNIAPPAPSRNAESRTPNESVNNTGTSADRGHKSPVPQGFFHAESQGATSFYPQARKQRLYAENRPCAECVFFCAGALFFLKGDHHG